MPIHKKKDWSIPEKKATDESVYLNRRRILTALGVGGAIVAAPLAFQTIKGIMPAREPIAPPEPDPSAGLYPVERNPAYTLDRDLSPEKDVVSYNNFYEFGSHKSIASAAQALRIRPWQVRFDGLVENERTVDIDDLLSAMPLEERLYRHRCVEAWSMAVPWSGFPLKALVDYAKPLSNAKYLVMATFHDPEMAPGQGASWYPWPYIEGLTIEEATNELAFIATGLYGKPIPRQNGAPLRPPCRALEIRVQVDQIDRPLSFHRNPPEDVLGGYPASRIRLLGQCEPGGIASTLEPGERAGSRVRRARAHPPL